MNICTPGAGTSGGQKYRYPRTGVTVSHTSSENWIHISYKNSQYSELLSIFLPSVLPLLKEYCKIVSKKNIFPKPGWQITVATLNSNGTSEFSNINLLILKWQKHGNMTSFLWAAFCQQKISNQLSQEIDLTFPKGVGSTRCHLHRAL